MNLVLLGILCYVALQLAIGYIVARRTNTEEDYLLAGRRLGPGIATMSIFATWFGAETCIGTSGQVYSSGLAGGRADPFGYFFCVLFMGLFFAVPLYRMRIVTLGDLFRRRYGPVVEKIAVLLLIPPSVYWAAAQISAFAQILSASSTLQVQFSLAIAAGIVIVYTALGGLLADAVTDLIQGSALILGLFALMFFILRDWPEPALVDAVALSPQRLRFTEPGESLFARLEVWAVPVIGSLFAQELISRTLAARSESVSRWACIWASFGYLFIGSIPLIIGLLGPALLPDLQETDQLLPHLAQHYFGPLLYVLFAGALVSAILSTVDSALLASAALLSHNVVLRAMPRATERQRLLISRICVIGAGVVAYLLATRGESVKELMIEASAFGTAGMFTAALFAFFPRFGGKYSAGAALISGVLAYWLLSNAPEGLVSAPYVYSVVVAVMAFVSVAAFERKRTDSDTETVPQEV